MDRTTGESLQEYKGHTCKSFKMDCCLTNSDAHVAGGSEDGKIYFWDLVDAQVVTSFQAHSSVVTSVSYHPKDDAWFLPRLMAQFGFGKPENWDSEALRNVSQSLIALLFRLARAFLFRPVDESSKQTPYWAVQYKTSIGGLQKKSSSW